MFYLDDEKCLPEALLADSNWDGDRAVDKDVDEAQAINLDIDQDNFSDNTSESSKDNEETLVDVPFIEYNSDADEEIQEARNKVRKFVQLKKTLHEKECEKNSDNGDRDQGAERDRETGNNVKQVVDTGKVIGYESEYLDSSDPSSYEDTSEGSIGDDARRHRSSRKVYDPSIPLDDFFLDLRFKDLKQFKNELVEFSTRVGVEFKYIKNDALRVRARCFAKGCN